jgi:hypothetical protein
MKRHRGGGVARAYRNEPVFRWPLWSYAAPFFATNRHTPQGIVPGKIMTDLPPKNPRHKKPRASRGPTIVQRSIDDPSRITKGVPDEIKIAVASAIMAFSDMEMSAEQFIWDVLGLSIDDGKLVTQIDTKEKIELAKKLSERYRLPLHPSAQATAEAWPAIRNAIEARNKMAHGAWVMIDEVPVVVSYRIPCELGQVNSEHFPLDRIEAVTSICVKTKGLFDRLCAKIATEGRPSPPPAPPSPEH